MKIAHFSDLHLLDLEGVPPHRFLNKRLTGYANLRLKRNHVHRASYVRAIADDIRWRGVDHVVVTGDLTNLALESEYRLAREVLDRDLAFAPEHVTIVPGNHDLYTRGAMKTARFAAYFAPYLASDLPELAVETGAGRFPVVKLRGPAAIIGLCSAVPRPPFVAAGVLGDEQLAALAKVLDHPEVQKRTPVIALHHPAHNPKSRLKSLLEGLHDADHFFARMESIAHGMVLHGHLHRRIQRAHTTRRGTMHAVGATSASLHHEDEARMAGYNVYEIGDDGRVRSIEARVYNPGDKKFHEDSVPKLV